MQSTIEDLYFCNHTHSENFKASDEYWKSHNEMCDIMDRIGKHLPDEDKKLLNDLYDVMGDCEYEQTLKAYKEGFKLGMRIAIESMT